MSAVENEDLRADTEAGPGKDRADGGAQPWLSMDRRHFLGTSAAVGGVTAVAVLVGCSGPEVAPSPPPDATITLVVNGERRRSVAVDNSWTPLLASLNEG